MVALRRRRAFTVVEFLVASILTLAVFAASALALESNSRGLLVDRSRDTATNLSYQVLDKARLYGCGTVTGDQNRDEVNLRERCGEIPASFADPIEVPNGSIFERYLTADDEAYLEGLTDPDSPSDDPQPLVDALEISSSSYRGAFDREGRLYYFTLNYEYDTAEGQMCSMGETNTAPSVVRYVVNVYWEVRSQVKSAQFVSTEPLPKSFRNARNGVVAELAGGSSAVTMRLEGLKDSEITRYTESDCAWFSGFGAAEDYDALRINGSDLIPRFEASNERNIRIGVS